MDTTPYYPVQITNEQIALSKAMKSWSNLVEKINSQAKSQKACIKNGSFLWGKCSTKLTNLKILKKLETAVGILTAINTLSQKFKNAPLVPSEDIIEKGVRYLLKKLRQVRKIFNIEKVKAPWRALAKRINAQTKTKKAQLEDGEFIWRGMRVSLSNKKTQQKLKHAVDILTATNKLNEHMGADSQLLPSESIFTFGTKGLEAIFQSLYHDFKEPEDEQQVIHLKLKENYNFVRAA